MIENPFVKRNWHRNLVRRNAPQEVVDWIDTFERTLETESDVEKLLNAFVMLGVEDPYSCDCGPPPHTDVWQWLHWHHDLYNGAVWETIENAGLNFTFKAAIFRDRLAVGEDPNFGKVLRKDYAWSLLTKFFGPRSEWFFPVRK